MVISVGILIPERFLLPNLDLVSVGRVWGQVVRLDLAGKGQHDVYYERRRRPE